MRSPWHCQATIQGVNDRSPPPQPEVASAATSAPQPLQTAPHHASATLAAPVTHYENFPVASLLCPPHLRQPIAAIYGFARTADDIADEGDALAAARLADLAAYHADLMAVAQGQPPSPRWASVFLPLQAVLRSHQLPVPLLADLLSAFAQDVEKTRDAEGYADRAELLDYCRRSANPVGRLLLHLYGVHDPASLAQSDQICSALQLINFWQDISVDLPRQRHYLPTELLRRHGLPREAFHADANPDAATQVRMAQAVAVLCAQARALMQQGAPLVRRIPGRAGWELRLVIQGGLLILDKIAALQHRSWQQRPRVGALDMPRLLWRALCMR